MRLVKDSVVYLLGELIARSFPFLLLPYLARRLGVDGFGELSYYQTFLALFGIVIGLSQEGAVARYFYFYGKRSMNLVLNVGYLYSTVVGLSILFVCWLVQSQILMIVTLCALFQSFLSVQLSVRQCQKQAISYVVIQLCYTLLSTVLTVGILELFSEDLVEKRFWAILAANTTIACSAYLIHIRRTSHKSFSFLRYKHAFGYVLSFGLPLLLHHISLFLRGQFDRIFIYHYFTEADLGLYAMGAQIATVLMIILQAINKALLPHLYEALRAGKISIVHIHRWAFLSLLIVPFPAILMWFLPDYWVTWVLGTQFGGTKYYMILFLFSTALSIPYLILVNYLFYYGKNKLISVCSVFSTLIYILSLYSMNYIEYIPYAGIISSLTLLFVLYTATFYVSKQNEAKK